MKIYPDANVELTKLSGGIFDVTVDGKLIFSKNVEGRFPDPAEVLKSLQQHSAP